jgi:hypothetical protein
LLDRSLIAVLAIDIQDFEKVNWHFSETVVIYSIVMWVAIIQQKFSDRFIQQFEMIFCKLHEIRLNENSQIVVLSIERHILTDSINDVFIEQEMICFLDIQVIIKKSLVVRHIWLESRRIWIWVWVRIVRWYERWYESDRERVEHCIWRCTQRSRHDDLNVRFSDDWWDSRMIWSESRNWSVWIHSDSWHSTLNNVSAWISDEWCFIASCSGLYVGCPAWVTWAGMLTTYGMVVPTETSGS